MDSTQNIYFEYRCIFSMLILQTLWIGTFQSADDLACLKRLENVL